MNRNLLGMLGAAALFMTTLSGCKSAPELTADQARTLIQAQYDKQPAAGVEIRLDDLGMRQAVTAKYIVKSKDYPNHYWADFTLTPDGKKVIKLADGKDTLEWRPESAADTKFSVVIKTVAETHLKAHDVSNIQAEGDAKTADFSEAVGLDGVPQPLVEIAHNPGNKLSIKRTAEFTVDGGQWALKTIR